LDRDVSGLADLRDRDGVTIHEVDLESGQPVELDENRFAGIVVTNYLHRPLVAHLATALAPGGALIYETFAQGNEALGRPRNPDFLLAPGELLELATPSCHVVAYEHGRVESPAPAIKQRICIVKARRNTPG
jgi:hypothetical protein